MKQADLKLSQRDFERFSRLLLERSGLYYTESKREALTRGLAKAMQTSRCTNLDEYYNLLRSHPSSHREWDQLVSVLTVGETYFFRNKGHFDALANHILPGIIAERERFNRRIRIWSAGCATGEEPYSVAMLLRELIPNLASWNILILATDLNRDALHRAREGLYSPWSFRGVDNRYRERYFRPAGKRYAIADEVKNMVTFDYLNLVEDHYPSLSNNTTGMDLILCRNVTIYFSAESTRQVIDRLYNCLADGGWFMPGASEPDPVTYNAFEHRTFPATVIYQKPTATAPAPVPSSTSEPLPAEEPAPRPAVVEDDGSKERLPPRPPKEQKERPAEADLLAEAKELMEAGQVDEALVKLYAKLDEDPECVPAYCLLGKIYANKGNLEEAQHWCERAIGKDKLQPEPYFVLSMIYQGHGLLEQAVDMLKKALYLDPGFALAHYTLANLYIKQGRHEPARRSLRTVQRLLAGRPKEERVPSGDGLVVGRMQELVEMTLRNGV